MMTREMSAVGGVAAMVGLARSTSRRRVSVEQAHARLLGCVSGRLQAVGGRPACRSRSNPSSWHDAEASANHELHEYDHLDVDRRSREHAWHEPPLLHRGDRFLIEPTLE